MIHTANGFGIVNKAEIDGFWNSLAFLMIQQMLAIWSLVPLPFLKPSWTSWSLQFMYSWSLAGRILSITLLACERSTVLQYFEHSLASLVTQRLKCLPAMWDTQVPSLGWEDPLEKEMATHSSILTWRIPWRGEPGRLQPMGSQRVRHNWATEHLVV